MLNAHKELNSLTIRSNNKQSLNLRFILIMKKWWKIFFILLLGFLFAGNIGKSWKTTLEILEENGFKGETHNVTTEDGYILTNYRINGGQNSTPVLLVSGLSITGSIWLMRGRNDSLAYLLADQGYDVWLINNRGTEYSLSHVNLTIDDSKFWNFSFHEMGVYDIPAVVNYVSKLRNQKVIIIGHSQGSTVGFIAGSRHQESAKNIRLMIHFAPLAFMNEMKGLIAYIHKPLYYFIQFLRKFITINKFTPTTTIEILEKNICMRFKVQSYICEFFGGLAIGFDHEQFVPDIWEGVFSSFSRGTSINNLLHFCQCIMSGKFRQYDHGKMKNIEIYNQTSPPDYNLSANTIPTVFFAAKSDWLSVYSNAKKAYKMLPNAKGLHVIEYEKFSHADFIWAKDVKKLFNNQIINFLNSYRET